MIRAEVRDVEKHVLANINFQVPAGVMRPFKLLKHPFGVLNPQAVFHGKVIIQRQIPFRVRISGNPPSLRILGHRRVLAEIERPEPDGVDVLLIVFQKLHGKLGILIPLTREPEKAHDVVPDAVRRRQGQAPLHHVRRGGLIHELQHPLTAGLIPHVEKFAAGVPGVPPHVIVQQTLFKADVRRPRNAQLLFLEPARQFAEQRRRIRLIRKVKMVRLIFISEERYLREHFLNLLGPIAGRVAFAVVAKLAPSPITPPGGQIRQHGLRHKIFLQGKPVKIRRRQRRHLFRERHRRRMKARVVAPQQIRDRRKVAVRPDGLNELQEGRFPFIHDRTVKERKEAGRLRQHVTQPRHRIAADGHVDVRKLLLNHGAERHRGKQLLAQHDGDPDNVRLFLDDGGFHEVLKHVAIDVHLRIVDRGEHI